MLIRALSYSNYRDVAGFFGSDNAQCLSEILPASEFDISLNRYCVTKTSSFFNNIGKTNALSQAATPDLQCLMLLSQEVGS